MHALVDMMLPNHAAKPSSACARQDAPLAHPGCSRRAPLRCLQRRNAVAHGCNMQPRSLQNLAVSRNLELRSAKFSVVGTQSNFTMVSSHSACKVRLW